MRVLVVDDMTSVREMMSMMMKHFGHTVVEASDGAVAKKLVTDGEVFDAIITDNNMPGMNGTEFLRWFRTEFETVVMTTLIISSGLDSRSIDELCHDHPDIKSMPKPIELNVLVEAGF